MSEHIDVRGLWPLLVKGQSAIELVNAPRHISVEQARAWRPEDERWMDTQPSSIGPIERAEKTAEKSRDL